VKKSISKKKADRVPHSLIRKYIAANGGTLKEIAAAMGVSVSTVSAAKKGVKGKPSPEMLPVEDGDPEKARLMRISRMLADTLIRVLMEVSQ
jgi:DNA invertase Pin-like site-specific DNA recombinase